MVDTLDGVRTAGAARLSESGVEAMIDRAHLEELLERAGAYKMTPADKEAQRRSFAYGNAQLSNPSVTREMVDRAAERLNHG